MHVFRYLASGDSTISLSYAFRIGASTVSEIINETCDLLWECLRELVLKAPSTDEDWLRISNEFCDHWQPPNCIGAIDGKHILIQAPAKSGSTFYNYYSFIVLLAVCDAHYKFLMVDIGSEGRHSDGGIFKNSSMGRLLAGGSLRLPEPSGLVDGTPMSYYLVADEAFPLTTFMMRPYPGKFLTQYKRIFNYRICRGRRLIENTFGILASRWRIFRKPIISKLSTAEHIIKATVCLHNWLMIQQLNNKDETQNFINKNLIDSEDVGGNLHEGEWRQEVSNGNFQNIERLCSNMYTRNAHEM
nr:unnamed protein product [Callosobruchus analis]